MNAILYSEYPSVISKWEDSFDLAQNQSFGFFSDIPESTWNRLREITSSREEHLIPGEHISYSVGFMVKRLASGEDKIPFQWFQSHYEPDFSCQFRKRVGGNGYGDGPKWVCDPHRLIDISKERKKSHPDRPGCLIYSVGSNGDFSFELALQNMLGKDTCEVHIFDMRNFAKKMPENMNMHFHQWGLSHESMESGYVYKSFQDTIKELGHEDFPAIDVFKIDCEGCEYATFPDWLDESTPMLQQILVETHASSANNMKDFFDSLKEAGYVKYSKEHNTQLPNLPCYEYGFLKLRKDYWMKGVTDPGIINDYQTGKRL